MTAQAALRQAVARLAGAGVESPARDARLLLADALDIAPGRVTLILQDPMPPGARARFDLAIAARVARQPVSQILGRRDFWGRRFRVTPDVLDPRPETETLIAVALAGDFDRVLDLGTGSGVILLTLLAERDTATGLGTDLSSAALAVAQTNAQALGVEARAEFLLSDWFARVAGQFDLIVSNPPYIAAADLAALAPEVRDWEPAMALSPGPDALAAYRVIVAGARRYLVPGGRLVLETGVGQGPAVAGLMAAAGLLTPSIHPDLDGRDRVVAAISA